MTAVVYADMVEVRPSGVMIAFADVDMVEIWQHGEQDTGRHDDYASILNTNMTEAEYERDSLFDTPAFTNVRLMTLRLLIHCRLESVTHNSSWKHSAQDSARRSTNSRGRVCLRQRGMAFESIATGG